MESITRFFTSNSGIFAAILAIVALVGALLKIYITVRDRAAESAELVLSSVKVDAPPPHSEAASASFEIMNASGGNAVMSDLLLIVTDFGKSEQPRMVEAAAPVPQFSFKVTLSPGVLEYDVRKREFGTPEPHSYTKGEIESFTIELRSTEPQWYEFHFLVRWYDVSSPDQKQDLKSETLRLEFKPDVEDMLG